MLNTSEQFWQGNLCCEHSSRCLGMQMFRYGGKCCTKHSVHKYLCTKTALVSHTVVFFASHPELNNKSKFLEKNLKYFVGLVVRKWPTTLAKAAEHFTNASSFWVAVVVVDFFILFFLQDWCLSEDVFKLYALYRTVLLERRQVASIQKIDVK